MYARQSNHNEVLPERFSREVAAGYDPDQIALSSIVLVGCGALGQFLALVLALVGFPRITFIDMDAFEESNLSRSPFYRKGWNKALATASGARKLCTAPGKTFYQYAETMVQALGDAVFQRTDRTIVFAAVDSQPARRWLAQRCRLLGLPFLEGGFRGQRWNLSVYPNSHADEPCWACDKADLQTERLFSCETYARQAIARGIIPATAPGAMVLAAAQAEAAIAWLHGESTLANTTVFGDLRRGSTRLMKRISNPECPLDHRLVSKEAVLLDVTPQSTVADLLNELTRRFRDPIIQLPASFIAAAPCRTCRQTALVEKPSWAIETAPLCHACGGPYRPAPNTLPEQHGTVSLQTSESICNTTLELLGLGPGLHLMVSGDEEPFVAKLGGNVEGFLEQVNDSEDAE